MSTTFLRERIAELEATAEKSKLKVKIAVSFPVYRTIACVLLFYFCTTLLQKKVVLHR